MLFEAGFLQSEKCIEWFTLWEWSGVLQLQQ